MNQPTTMEERISCEDNLSGAILHKPANAVLCMTWGIESLDYNVSNLETFAILRGLCYSFTILAADDRLSLKLRMGQLLSIC